MASNKSLMHEETRTILSTFMTADEVIKEMEKIILASCNLDPSLTRGVRTCHGCGNYRDFSPDSDCEVGGCIRNLRDDVVQSIYDAGVDWDISKVSARIEGLGISVTDPAQSVCDCWC